MKPPARTMRTGMGIVVIIAAPLFLLILSREAGPAGNASAAQDSATPTSNEAAANGPLPGDVTL